MLEISIIRNGEVTYDSLNRRQKKNVYSMSVFGLAMLDLDQLSVGNIAFNFNGWSAFGIKPTWVVLFIAVLAGVTVLKSILSNADNSLQTILKEFLWLLIALIPALVGVILMFTNFHIYM